MKLFKNNFNLSTIIIEYVSNKNTYFLLFYRYLGLQNYPPKEYNKLLGHKENCDRYPFLRNRQQQLCDLGEKIMSVSKCSTRLVKHLRKSNYSNTFQVFKYIF